MRVVVALGGNALLKRDEPMTAEVQRRNIRVAAQAMAPVAQIHQLVISHGNGPQVGLLALQGAAYKPDEAYPLDVLGAETEGMIGYMIEQELAPCRRVRVGEEAGPRVHHVRAGTAASDLHQPAVRVS
jgi:carbamate kinase